MPSKRKGNRKRLKSEGSQEEINDNSIDRQPDKDLGSDVPKKKRKLPEIRLTKIEDENKPTSTERNQGQTDDKKNAIPAIPEQSDAVSDNLRDDITEIETHPKPETTENCETSFSTTATSSDKTVILNEGSVQGGPEILKEEKRDKLQVKLIDNNSDKEKVLDTKTVVNEVDGVIDTATCDCREETCHKVIELNPDEKKRIVEGPNEGPNEGPSKGHNERPKEGSNGAKLSKDREELANSTEEIVTDSGHGVENKDSVRNTTETENRNADNNKDEQQKVTNRNHPNDQGVTVQETDTKLKDKDTCDKDANAENKDKPTSIGQATPIDGTEDTTMTADQAEVTDETKEEGFTDSQLCAFEWMSQFPEEQENSSPINPDQPSEHGDGCDQIEDGSTIITGFIKELSLLNKMILKTKREIENARRQRKIVSK